MRRIVSRQVRKLRARRAAGVETRVAGAEHRDAPVGLPSTGGRGRTQRRPGTRLLYLRRARQLHFETLEPRLAPDALLAGTALVASVLAGGVEAELSAECAFDEAGVVTAEGPTASDLASAGLRVDALLEDGLLEDELADYKVAVGELDAQTLRTLATDLLRAQSEPSERVLGLVDALDDAALDDFVLFLAALNNDLSLSSVFGDPLADSLDGGTAMMGGGGEISLVSASATLYFSRSQGGTGVIGGTLFAPMFYQPWGLHRVGVSVDGNPAGFAIPSPASEVFVPPGGFSSAPLVVTPAVVQAGSYTARATFQGQEKTAPVHVVDTTDVALEYQKPDGTWSPPDTFLVGASGVPVVSAADPLRWEATFTHDTAQLQPTWVSLEAISWSDWLARQQVPPTEAWPTVVTGENCTGPTGSRECIAHGAPNVGDWAVRAVVWYNGGPAGGGGPGGVGEPARQLTPEHVVVMEIESVDWWEDTVRADAGDLTPPPSGHAGQAFFPDAETAQDPANPALRVELLVNPNMAGIPILAKWVDVDDPFYSTAPLDEDQIGTGDLNSPDNRFDTARFDGAGQQVQLVTDGNGEASVVFLTSMQPGNNYRIVASLHQANLDTLKPMKVQGTALIWKDLDNDDTYDLNEPLLDETSPYSPAEGKVSQLLTVWRILDVEMDAFGPPAPGIVWDPDDDVPVANVPFPDPGLLAQAFEPAFVLAVPYQDQGNVPFTQPNYNLEEAEMPALAGYRQVGVTPAFWAAYVMQGYDSMLAKDNDPNSEPATVGHTKHLTPALSFVFLETIRDILVNEHPTYNAVLYAQQTVAHEIGHHFIPDRQDGHLMDPTAAPSGDGLTFSENDLALIRNKVQPQ